VRWWLRGENIYVAHNIDVGKAIRYVLDGLEQQVMYEIRVFGYSRGGDGLQSSPVLEFVLGVSARIYNVPCCFLILTTLSRLTLHPYPFNFSQPYKGPTWINMGLQLSIEEFFLQNLPDAFNYLLV